MIIGAYLSSLLNESKITITVIIAEKLTAWVNCF